MFSALFETSTEESRSSQRHHATMSFDFDAAVSTPFRMQPGLRRLAPGARQLTPSGPGSRHMREKLAVLSAFPSQALLLQPGFDAAPALDALASQAALEHPATLAWDGQRAAATLLGVSVVKGEITQFAGGASASATKSAAAFNCSRPNGGWPDC